jgi:excinuclease UvrABC nuclease subunit
MIKRQMNRAAHSEHFELAARYRNQLQSLTRLQDVAILNQSFFTDTLVAQVLPRNKTIARAHRTAAVTVGSYNIERIEGYDISNLGTTGKVGSMVVFTHGEADKGQYRKFKIRHVEGQSDVDCMAEMIERRLNHAEWPLPFAFLIDGGKPQVNRVKAVLAKRNVTIPVVGIAKGPERKRNDFEFGTAPSDDTEAQREFIRWVAVNQETLIRVRDEAHRFAIGYQRKLRRL